MTDYKKIEVGDCVSVQKNLPNLLLFTHHNPIYLERKERMEINDKLYNTKTILTISETNIIDHIFTVRITGADYSANHIFLDKKQLKGLRDYINSKLKSEGKND